MKSAHLAAGSTVRQASPKNCHANLVHSIGLVESKIRNSENWPWQRARRSSATRTVAGCQHLVVSKVTLGVTLGHDCDFKAWLEIVYTYRYDMNIHWILRYPSGEFNPRWSAKLLRSHCDCKHSSFCIKSLMISGCKMRSSGRAAKERNKKDLDWFEASYQRDIKGLKQFARKISQNTSFENYTIYSLYIVKGIQIQSNTIRFTLTASRNSPKAARLSCWPTTAAFHR